MFISCGQQNDREKEIGKAVGQHFAKRGFETYFAELVHSSEALTENIFRFLENSEYFVFIDFRRDKIRGKKWLDWMKGTKYKGSLFVNQELAIATFLKLDGIGFVERGVKREGILNYQIYNANQFEDGNEILAALGTETAGWDPESVNELAIRYDPDATTRGIMHAGWPGGPKPSDWYHLEVLNRNKRKHALSCMGYVSQIRDQKNERLYDLPTNELNWSAIKDVSANIIAGARRDLDIFYVVQGHDQIIFHERPLGTTNPRYHLPRLDPGSYEIQLMVVAANFATVEREFLLEYDGSRNVRFEENTETSIQSA